MTDTNKIWNNLNEIFREVFKNENLKISHSTKNTDIDGWTSLNHAILIDAIEKKFSLTFDLDEILTMQTVEDIFKTIESKINS
ncbi:MAG: acyl carrier protein [Bacteroidales bacterium]|nr:acyl carrier protein [Bacteroidales bacterium]